MEPLLLHFDGQVSVVAANVPADMPVDARARAIAARQNDIMMMLEREGTAVEEAVSEKVRDFLAVAGARSAKLALADDEPRFTVTCELDGGDSPETARPSKEALEAVEHAIADALLDAVRARASQTGLWEPVVTVSYRRPEAQTRQSARSGSQAWRWLAGVLLALLVGVGVFVWHEGGR